MDGADMVTNVADRSGRGNNASLITTRSTSSAQDSGKIGQAIKLVETGDYIRGPHFTELEGGDMTFATWVKFNTLSTSQWIMQQWEGGNGPALFLYVSPSPILTFELGSYADNIQVALGSRCAVGVWCHIAATARGTTLTMYINGELAYQDVRTRQESGSEELFTIGGPNGDGSIPVLNGSIDDARVYSRALSPSEISRLYAGSTLRLNAPSIGDASLSSGLVGWWTLDAKDTNWASGAITDRSGNGRTLHAIGMSTSSSPMGGKLGQAMNFSNTNQWLQGESAPAFISTLDQPHSAFAWVKPSATTTTTAIWSFGEFDDLNYTTGLGLANNVLCWLFNGVENAGSSGMSVPVGKWSFVGFVRNPTTMTYYVNGASTTMNDALNSAVHATDVHLIGKAARNTVLEGGFAGAIDDVRVYSRALSDAEVTRLYRLNQPTLNASRPGGTSLSSGLVGWWTMDGKDVNWGSGRVSDRSGAGNHGYVVGMSTSTSPAIGKMGQALSFDKTNDRISFSSDFIGTGDRTFSAWIYARSEGSDAIPSIIENRKSIFFYDGYVPAISYTSDNVTFAQSAVGAIAYNRWHFVAVTRTSAGVANIYVDGVLSGSANQSSGTPTAGSTEVNIGSSAFVSRLWDGRIDDVRVYDRVLSAREIQQLYSQGR
jgi:hypothetical protein